MEGIIEGECISLVLILTLPHISHCFEIKLTSRSFPPIDETFGEGYREGDKQCITLWLGILDPDEVFNFEDLPSTASLCLCP